MIYIKLFLTFFKISLFNFGGGYVMIPLIQEEIVANNWLTSQEFVDIIAIAEMTPGAIAVNSATLVGFKVAGILGAITATAAIPTIAFIFATIISKYVLKFNKHPLNKMIFYGIRPVIVGLILSSAVLVAETAVFRSPVSLDMLSQLLKAPLQIINIGSMVIFALTLILLVKFKLHPILTIISSGLLGIIVFSFM